MPTTDELDARVRVLEERAGITPPSTGPAPEKPAKPGRPDVAITKDAVTLTWPAQADADEYDVLDTLNTAASLKQTVTEPRYVGSPYKAGKPARRYAVRARNAAGESELSDVVDVPSAGGGGIVVGPRTGIVIENNIIVGVDLSRWKLTIPEVSGGKVVEIRPPDLAAYSSKYFERLPDGSLRFRVWHGGATTSGSSNPRSELRERVGDDPEGYWPLRTGRHTMTVAGQVNRLTKVKPHVVIAQIHAKSKTYDDVTVWRVEGNQLWITNGNTAHGHLVDDKLQLGQRYTLHTEVADGRITFAYNGQPVDYSLPAPDDVAYFKAGCYAQTNPTTAPRESTTEYDEVIVFSAAVSHAA